jgi:hypothetical protein
MRYPIFWPVTLLTLVFAAACADAPTISSEDRRTSVEAAGANNTYVLDPVIVIGKCDPYTDINWCEGGGGGTCMSSTPAGDTTLVYTSGCEPAPVGGGGSGGTGGSGGSGGTGGTSTPCPDYGCPQPEPISPGEAADDEMADCVDIGCELRNATESERAKVEAEIAEIRDEGFCGQVKANARVMIARHLQVWSNRVTVRVDGKDRTLLGEAPYDYNRGGPVMYLYTGAINSWTIAHEAIHGLMNPNSNQLYYTHSAITPLGMDLDDTAKYCSRN